MALCSRSRRKNPLKPPFVPPPARTSRVLPSGSKFNDEQRLRLQMTDYEKKVDSLLNEMGNLRTVAELERAKRDLVKQDFIRERETALQELANLDRGGKSSDPLLRKLLETEIDADQAAMNSHTLEELLSRPSANSAAIADAGAALRSSLSKLQLGTRALRALLREREQSEVANTSLAEQRETLLRKLAEGDGECARLREQLSSQAAANDDLRSQASRERDAHANASRERTELEGRVTEAGRRIRELEGENARQLERLRAAEEAAGQRISEAERARQEAQDLRERSERERDATAKNLAKLRERLSRAEDALERAKREAGEKEARAAELVASAEQTTRRAERAGREKAETLALVAQQRARLEELESELRARQEAARKDGESQNERLRERSNETVSLRAENERLRLAHSLAEQKVRQLEADCERAHSSGKNDEKQCEELRLQLQRAVREKEELATRLEETQRLSLKTQRLAESEMEQMRTRFQQRVQELEPLPEMLKTMELKAQEAREREQVAERRASEHSRALAELTSKFENAVEREADARARLNAQQDESKQLANRLEATEKRVRELESQSHELITALAKRDETLLSNASRLEERTRENAALTRQLEQALSEVRHHSELSREKASAREHQLHARTCELDAQIAQARAEAARLKREKEELQQRLNARILDLKDRLEQSASTNRSMQHYVQFLKQSYTSVFNSARTDTVTATSGFGDLSLSFEAPTITAPMPTTQAYSRSELSASSSFSDR